MLYLTDTLNINTSENGEAVIVFKNLVSSRAEFKIETNSLSGKIQIIPIDPVWPQPQNPPNLWLDNSPIGGNIVDLSHEYFRQGLWIPGFVGKLSKIVVRTRGMVAGSIARLVITRQIEDAAVGRLNAILLEATLEIDALEDLIGLGAGNVNHSSWLAEWRSYRLAVCRLVKRGVDDSTTWPPKPVSRII